MRRGYVVCVAMALALFHGGCGSDPDSNPGGLVGGEGGSGGLGGTAGGGGTGGPGGSGGTAGEGGTGGSAGEGGSGGAECSAEDFQSEACQACIAAAMIQCGSDAGCATGMIQFAACAADAGCVDDTGINYVCAAMACPAEATAVAQCIAGCEAMRACAGM